MAFHRTGHKTSHRCQPWRVPFPLVQCLNNILHNANLLHSLACDLSAVAVVPISAIVVVIIVVMSTMISIPLTIAVVSIGRFFSVERSFRRSIGIDVVVIAIFAIIGQRGLGWSIRVNITDVTIVTVA